MAVTRQHFREELAQLEYQALGGLDMVVSALDRVVEALEQHDVELAGFVVADDDRIDGRYLEVHQGLLSLMALQAPVAGDLRVVAALLHVIKHIERMGDQCVNIAKLVPLDGFEPPEDAEILAAVRRMADLVKGLIVQARLAFERRDTALAEDLVRRDDDVDLLNRAIFRRALEIGDDPDVREWAMHMTFVGRGLERIGDNAVDVGEQAAFVATGLFREFADASHVVPRDIATP
jgi:phosphate transport system protein